jgi:hypothetical protein
MYIRPDARESYRHWWDAQIATYALWFAYRHLNIPALHYVPRVPWKKSRYRSSYRGHYVRPWDISTSGESGFRQDGYHRKDIDEKERSRRDWRERKGFRRDKARSRRHWCSCGRYVKDVDHHSRRAYERQMIHTEDWDNFVDHQDMFVSNWDCC